VVVVAATLAWAGPLTVASPAAAHDVIRSTNPADGATVDRLPDRVVLTFDEPALALGSEVVVTGPAGPVSDGPPSLVDNEVRQAVRAGPAGRYTVLWRVTSADGHPVSGTFAFTTQQAGAGPTSTAPASASSEPSASSSASTSASSGVTSSSATTPAVSTATAAAQPATAPTSGSPVVVVVAVVVVLLVLVAVGGWWWRRRPTRP
jgi:methionine-rich copper-binding protein CopC